MPNLELQYLWYVSITFAVSLNWFSDRKICEVIEYCCEV